MPTRFYFPHTEAADVSPAITDWFHISGTRRKLRTSPGTEALTKIEYNPDPGQHIADVDSCHTQFVSDPLVAQTISGTVKAQLEGQEAGSNDNQHLAFKLWVCSGDGSTVRGVLLAITRDDVELSTSFINRQFTASLSSLAISAGDRLVVELGYGGLQVDVAGAQRHLGRFILGGIPGGSSPPTDLGDLPEDDTTAGSNIDSSSYRPWIEFSDDLTAGDTITGESLVRNRQMGTPAIGTGEPIQVTSLVRSRALGTPGMSPSIYVTSLVRNRTGGFPHTAYVVGVDTFVIPSILRNRQMGTPAFLRSIEALSIIRNRQLGLPVVVPPGAIVVTSLLRNRRMGQAFVLMPEPPHLLKLRVLDTQYGPPGIIIAKCVEEDTVAYQDAGLVGGSPSAPSSTISLPGSTRLFLWDSVLLQDADAALGFYAAVSGFNPDWIGATLSKSTDGGQSYVDLLIIQEQAVLGYAQTALGTVADHTIKDTVNSVDIQLLRPDVFDLVSMGGISGGGGSGAFQESAFQGGAFQTGATGDLGTNNAFALIKANGGVEIVQYETATLLSSGYFRLTNLWRGRRSSQAEVAGHGILDRFVLLSPTAVKRVTADEAEIGIERLYKATSSGTAFEDAGAVRFTWPGVTA